MVMHICVAQALGRGRNVTRSLKSPGDLVAHTRAVWRLVSSRLEKDKSSAHCLLLKLVFEVSNLIPVRKVRHRSSERINTLHCNEISPRIHRVLT